MVEDIFGSRPSNTTGPTLARGRNLGISSNSLARASINERKSDAPIRGDISDSSGTSVDGSDISSPNSQTVLQEQPPSESSRALVGWCLGGVAVIGVLVVVIVFMVKQKNRSSMKQPMIEEV